MSAASMLRQVAQECKSFPRKFVEEASTDVSKSIDKTLAVDTGRDRVLSGTARGGKRTKLTVRKKVTGDTVAVGTISPGPAGRPVAMWHWLEYGTGEPGPTRAKSTWSRSASPALDRAARKARQTFQGLMQ